MAELQNILEENDFTLSFTSVNILPKKPTRAQIEDVLVDNGIALPLAKSNTFYISSANDRNFFVIYSKSKNAYFFELMDEAQ